MRDNKPSKLGTIAMIILVAFGSYSLGYNTAVPENNSYFGQEFEDSEGISESTGFNYDAITKNIKHILTRIESTYLNDIDYAKAEEGIYKGILDSLGDPYSVYYSEEEYEELNQHTAGEFGGIGIQVSAADGEYIVVIAPIKGTPGEKAGILPGDKITHIEGEAIFAKDLDSAVGKMRGTPGTDVTITIQRGEGAKTESIDMTITRAIINVDSVYTHMIDENIGYLQITGFQEKTATEFKKGLADLKSQGAKKIVLDLRNNPGGLLDVTMEIADVLMDDVKLMNIVDKSGNEEVITLKKGKDDIEIVTLINEGSASASEILSGALQDNGRSKIVGKTTFGKGVMQNVYPVNNAGKSEGLKLTSAEFTTPNNNKIHGIGISPDIEVDLPEGVTRIGVEYLDTDTQLQKAIELLK